MQSRVYSIFLLIFSRAAIGLAVSLNTLLILTACSGGDNSAANEDGVKPNEQTRVIFSPATGDLPVPNDLLFSRPTEAQVAAGAATEPSDGTFFAGSPAGNPVVAGINALDGASVTASIYITFDASLNDAQNLSANSFISQNGAVIPNPEQNVFLLPLLYPSGESVRQEPGETPTLAEAASYARAAATSDSQTLAALAAPRVRAEVVSLDSGINNTLRITPLTPLLPETKYLIVLTNGIEDANGNATYPSIAYEFTKDPESTLEGSFAGLAGVRAAIQGWERLAAGYFSFMQSVFDQAALTLSAPRSDAIIFSLTFTTGGTDASLASIAAPQTWFEKNIQIGLKQGAIGKLLDGTYNLNGDNTGLTDETDITINSTINFLLVSPDSPLYNPAIAAAINNGAGYSDVTASDASAAFILQTAAAEAAISVNDGDGISIAAEAAGSVQAIAAGATVPVNEAFPIPSPRPASFYRVDPSSAINPSLVAPGSDIPLAQIYQGQITLPYYSGIPTDSDGSSLVTEKWISDKRIGGIIDFSRGNEPGSTPPSDNITYRYPFPEKQGDVTVPALVTLPNEAIAGAKPDNGWPVIIFVHGITGDRSNALTLGSALAAACVTSSAPCFATIAIDQSLHGVVPSGSTLPGLISVDDPDTPVESNITGILPSDELGERHFNYTANGAGGVTAMLYDADFGASGSLTINLSSFPTARDNLRQTVLDLLNLNASLPFMDVDNNGLADDVDSDRLFLIGHSLGAMVSTPFLAINNSPDVQNSPFSDLPKIRAAALNFPGGHILRLLTNSPSFAPPILQGLAASSEELTQGRSGLETYFSAFQGNLDSVDPINFAAKLADNQSDTGILFFEVIGDGVSNPKDQSIPNAADTLWGEDNGPLNTVLSNGFTIAGFSAPLAGSEPLIAQFGAIKTAQASSDGDPAVLITRLTEGSHRTPVSAGSTVLDPLTTQAAFDEIVAQTATFFALEGDVSASIVANPEVVEE